MTTVAKFGCMAKIAHFSHALKRELRGYLIAESLRHKRTSENNLSIALDMEFVVSLLGIARANLSAPEN